jgi:hypothetical protein
MISAKPSIRWNRIPGPLRLVLRLPPRLGIPGRKPKRQEQVEAVSQKTYRLFLFPIDMSPT